MQADTRNPTKVAAAVFDLEGFTWFCSENESLIGGLCFDFAQWVSHSLHAFEPTKESIVDPFFAKFLGDGFLFLWKLDNPVANRPEESFEQNLISYLSDICISYNPADHEVQIDHNDPRRHDVQFFFPEYSNRYPDLPAKLRIGLAFGDVQTYHQAVGTTALPTDYVGSCINLASRLQKLDKGLSFAAQRSNLNKVEAMRPVSVKVRGFREAIDIFVLSGEYEALKAEKRAELFF